MLVEGLSRAFRCHWETRAAFLGAIQAEDEMARRWLFSPRWGWVPDGPFEPGESNG